jgi:hypothetical protein
MRRAGQLMRILPRLRAHSAGFCARPGDSGATKPADIPETEFAIRDLDRTKPDAPTTASAHSSSQPAVPSEPVPLPTVTLAPRRFPVFGIVTVSVIFVATATAARVRRA